jgi:hypothetical protein
MLNIVDYRKNYYQENKDKIKKRVNDSNLIKENRLRTIWRQMKARCFNLKTFNYFRYGGRGITVCENWISFDNFLKDMGSSYQRGLTLERINNNENYSKENCKWATYKEQANNRRSGSGKVATQFFTFNGLTKSLQDWADYLGIKRGTLAQRYYVYKWKIEKCLSEGVRNYVNK